MVVHTYEAVDVPRREARRNEGVLHFALWYWRSNCPVNVGYEVEETLPVERGGYVLVGGTGELLETFTGMSVHHRPPFGPPVGRQRQTFFFPGPILSPT